MKRKSMVIIVAVSFAALMLSLGALLSHGAALRETVHNNCLQIESLKKQLRPEPFDQKRTYQILLDLGIDPTSEVGRRLVMDAREQRAKQRAKLAPGIC